MAENVANEQLEKRSPDAPAPDPIADRSMSGPLVICSLLLIATLLWALFDEVFGQRPWKNYQGEFADAYSQRLKQIQPDQAKAEQELRQSPKYQELQSAVEAAEAESRDRLTEINREVSLIDQQLMDITEPYQNERAWLAAQTYNLETVGSESARQSIRNAMEERKNQKVDIEIHTTPDDTEDREPTFKELEALYLDLTNRKAQLTAETIALTKPATEARKKRDDYFQANLTGLSPSQIDGLISRTKDFDYRIRQIHVAEADLVDRCESCHLGIREPLTLTADQMGGERAFVSHPNKDLLKIHDPERFGCSTCHGGNGRGTTSVEKAHGQYKHWLWPLYAKENVQAGCNSCHNSDRVTAGADALNHAKDLYQSRGCVGCHRYEGFDRESEGLATARQNINTLEMEREARLKEIRETQEAADKAAEVEEARALLRRTNDIRQMISTIDARIDEIDDESKYLLQDQKKVGPNLKEIKAKLRKEWLPMWLFDPQAFRPGTKMPSYRLNDDEIKAISAFLWQSALDAKVPAQPPGDANHGKELFKSIGCMACHSIDGRSIDMPSGAIGGDFAANLSRLGEKANYDYIVRWVHNPRERLSPYSPTLKRDLTPEDYAKKNLPFVFDDMQSSSPVDGHELQVQNMTVMPNFRLSDQDARDIATFLMSQKLRDIQYPDASYLDDQSLKGEGERLVKMYGCAGCHEIKGLEEEQRIGTELTPEGSKPIERLDFALLTHVAKDGEDPFTGEDREKSWYNHKGFFEHKLMSPGIYDRGKEKPVEERLRMPNIYLKEGDITALTTFLLGSVTTTLPESLRYNPGGERKQVQDGWWVIQKYNCAGCHNVLIGQESTLMQLPMYQSADGFEQLPPRLTSEGARVNPDWLLRFLKDPSLATEQERQAATAGLMAHLSGSPPAAQAQPGQAQPHSGAAQAAPAQQANPTRGAASGASTAGATPQAASPAGTPMTARGLGPQPGANRNGVRSYLRVRMPTFNFSPNELQAVVNFFMGASAQQQPYIPERLDPLTPQEQSLARAMFQSPAAPCLKCHMTGDPAHDVRATAPNFLLAGQRLKPDWTRRWIIDPQMISPGTSMPSELFELDTTHNRWVLKGTQAPGYEKDHATLLVRYMFQLSGDEQRRLSSAPATPAPAAPPPATAAAQRQNPRRPANVSAIRAP